ncbi:asp (abnormal spindle) homolog, microcephaly associated (Drosophila) [Seminavis robusta]|uniref:Asp (Abnormal spindle) homolog, microcephaly associated (Drosophila) n=1 Tax=Seminavis robusta TaxID=568900 RepID=A0A9N8DAT5_9STRA|nr:asp (abnormal spindle) homolog, microcephaly associated (Drosophila) [Seminavis robusta]|eukprot:Sro37_g023220.1 asp (abnormal spindle) homolog, microcephaly associated (Drosophila) (1444) ;mRNA; r:71282-75889
MRGRTRAGDGSNDAELVLPSGNRDEGRHRHQQHAKDTRLFDKLNQLERKWHSQKGNNNNKLAIGGVSLNQNHSFSSQRDPPPGSPPIEATGSMPPPSEALPVSSTSTEPKQLPPKKKKKKKKEGPRVVTMFDRLYQKGKAKAITKNITVLPQTKPSANRNKRRLRAAIIIQSVFRGVKLRKHVRYLSGTAFVIQWWWRNIAQRLFYIRLRGLTIIIQSLERRRVAIKAAQEIRGSAATIQSLWRMRCAKRQRKMLEEDLEKRIRESNASKLIQFHLRKHIKVIRQQRVECVSLMVEEINDGVETLSGDSSTSESISSDHPPDLILSADSLEENPSDEAGEADEEKRKVTPNEDKLAPTEDSAKPLEHDEKPSVSSASASLFRAAQLRRRALKQPVSNVPQDTVARSVLAHRRKNLGIKEGTVPPRKYKSIAYEYLPTNKTYWTYDSHKLARIPIIQRWAKKRMREKLLWRSSVNIQCAWRINRSQFELISLYLLKEWAVRVDFRQEETTNNPVLRQKVRLLALAKAIRQVNDESLPPEVLRTPYSFVVNWKTETSIYFAEDQGIAQLNRCRIHVVCEAHRHPLWEDWSNQKKFTHLSKVALLRSFSNQCARLSRASVLMQSLRMRRILWKMAREKEAAMTIQRFWSRYGHETDEMVYLQQAKSAAIRLQAFWRMTSAVLLLEIQDMSASSIQALFRGFTIREQYLEAKFGITGFQAVYRGRREYRSFNLKCRTVLHIQRAIRGFIARARLDHQAYAALAIQDWYRAVALRVCMSKIRLSYSILQCLVQRQAILSRLQKEQAAVRLQAWLRKVSCRSFHLQQIQSGTHVQSVYRGWQARKAFCIVVRGVVLLQASARTRRDQELFSQWKRSANAIRGVWLTYITRTRFLRLCRVVSIVQTLMRERRARRSSATRLSAWWRTCVCLRHIDESKKLAVTVQKIFRGHQGRLRHKHLSYLRLYAAAAKLQSWWRLNLAFDAYTIMQLSVVDIQRSYRAYSARQRYKIALQTLKTASATKLQGWWRMAIVCETYNVLYVSVWDVQRCYRGYRTRKALVEARMYLGAVKFQALWRVSHMRSIFKKLCHATMTLQRVYRGHKTRSEIQNARMCSAETHLAAAWRRFHARKCYKDLCRSAILAQRICRGHLGRKRFEFLHAQHVFRTATKLQAFCRMCAQSKRFTKVCASALLAQRIVRGCVARRRYNALVEAHFAAVLIQAAWDDYRDRMATRLYLAIVSVQKCYRGYQVRSSIDPLAAFFYSKGKACGYLRLMHYNSYRQMQASSLVLQRWQRMTTCKRDFEELKMGVAAIQACFRGYSARCSFHEQVEAATIIQAWRRMTVKVEDFEEMLVASIIIQSLFRGFSQRRQTKASLRAFVAIQSLFRMRRCVQNLMETRSSQVEVHFVQGKGNQDPVLAKVSDGKETAEEKEDGNQDPVLGSMSGGPERAQ